MAVWLTYKIKGLLLEKEKVKGGVPCSQAPDAHGGPLVNSLHMAGGGECRHWNVMRGAWAWMPNEQVPLEMGRLQCGHPQCRAQLSCPVPKWLKPLLWGFILNKRKSMMDSAPLDCNYPSLQLLGGVKVNPLGWALHSSHGTPGQSLPQPTRL